MKSIISNLITGGAGFLGSHILESLLNEGERVICLDNFLTGSEKNISKWITNSNFKLIDHQYNNHSTPSGNYQNFLYCCFQIKEWNFISIFKVINYV